MPYISYNNVRAFLSNGDSQSLSTGTHNTLYATSFTANNTTQLKRVKRIGQVFDYYIQTGPKSASISTSVIPITGAGFNQFTGFLALTGDFTSGSYIQVPNYRFDKCFLKSFNFSLEPWKPLSLDMQFESYGLAAGNGVDSYVGQDFPTGAQTGIISPLRGMSISLTATGFTQTINQYENLNFGIEVERLANFEVGSAYPAKVSVSKITKTLQIDGISNADWLSDYEPNNSVRATITMADGNTFSVAGVLASEAVSINNGNAVKVGIQIVEDMSLWPQIEDPLANVYYLITSAGDRLVDSSSNKLIAYI